MAVWLVSSSGNSAPKKVKYHRSIECVHPGTVSTSIPKRRMCEDLNKPHAQKKKENSYPLMTTKFLEVTELDLDLTTQSK